MDTQEIQKRIETAFEGTKAAALDPRGSGDYFDVRISENEALKALSRVKKHQAIMKLFDDELKSGEIHALALKFITL